MLNFPDATNDDARNVKRGPSSSRRTAVQQRYRNQLVETLRRYRKQGELWKALARDFLETEQNSAQYGESKQGVTPSQVVEMLKKNKRDALYRLYKLGDKEIEKIEQDTIWFFLHRTEHDKKCSIGEYHIEEIFKRTKNHMGLRQEVLVPKLMKRDHYTGYWKEEKLKESWRKLLSRVPHENVKDILWILSEKKLIWLRTSPLIRKYLLDRYLSKVSVEDQREIIDIFYDKNSQSLRNYRTKISSKNKAYFLKKELLLNNNLSPKEWGAFSKEERSEIYHNLMSTEQGCSTLLQNLKNVDKEFHPIIFKNLLKKEHYTLIKQYGHLLAGITINEELWLKLVKAWCGAMLRKLMETNPKKFTNK